MKTKLLLIFLLSFFLLGCGGVQYPFLITISTPFSLEGSVSNLTVDSEKVSFDIDGKTVDVNGFSLPVEKMKVDYARVDKIKKPINTATIINAYYDDELVMVVGDNIEQSTFLMNEFRLDTGDAYITSVVAGRGQEWVGAKLIDRANNVTDLVPGVVTSIKHKGAVWNVLLLGALSRIQGSDAPVSFLADIVVYK